MLLLLLFFFFEPLFFPHTLRVHDSGHVTLHLVSDFDRFATFLRKDFRKLLNVAVDMQSRTQREPANKEVIKFNVSWHE